MSKRFLDDLQVDLGGEHHRGGHVTQVMEADRWQSGHDDECGEPVAESSGIVRSPASDFGSPSVTS